MRLGSSGGNGTGASGEGGRKVSTSLVVDQANELLLSSLERYLTKFPPKYDHPATDPLPLEILLHILTHLLPDDMIFRPPSKKSNESQTLDTLAEHKESLEKAQAELDADSWPRNLYACARVSRSFLTAILTLISRNALPTFRSLRDALPLKPDGTPARPLDNPSEPRTSFVYLERNGIRDYTPLDVPFARDVEYPAVGVGEIEERKKRAERWRFGLSRWEKDKAA